MIVEEAGPQGTGQMHPAEARLPFVVKTFVLPRNLDSDVASPQGMLSVAMATWWQAS